MTPRVALALLALLFAACECDGRQCAYDCQRYCEFNTPCGTDVEECMDAIRRCEDLCLKDCTYNVVVLPDDAETVDAETPADAEMSLDAGSCLAECFMGNTTFCTSSPPGELRAACCRETCPP